MPLMSDNKQTLIALGLIVAASGGGNILSDVAPWTPPQPAILTQEAIDTIMARHRMEREQLENRIALKLERLEFRLHQAFHERLRHVERQVDRKRDYDSSEF